MTPHFSEDKNNGKVHFFEDKNTTTLHFSEDRHKVLELFETSKQLVKRGIKNTEKGAKNNYTRVRDKTQSLCQLPRSASLMRWLFVSHLILLKKASYLIPCSRNV